MIGQPNPTPTPNRTKAHNPPSQRGFDSHNSVYMPPRQHARYTRSTKFDHIRDVSCTDIDVWYVALWPTMRVWIEDAVKRPGHPSHTMRRGLR